ncbi:MAG: hypothetical protein COA79_26505 [Planctomycetota bacterium]|nr:MAG: hypothetical protein COA79_26505 [Planctomycetota bacterium]
MSEFIIESCKSDLRLVLSNYKGDYFDVEITSASVSAKRKVYAYTDAHTFADFMEHLASKIKPWTTIETWKSLECELEIIVICDVLGHVTFTVELSKTNGSEDWILKQDIESEFGQLPTLAKSAREFFGPTPE